MLKFLSLFICCLLSFSITAQQDFSCGTPEGRSDWLKKFQANPQAYDRSAGELWVPVQIHNVGTDDGQGFYPDHKLIRAFCDLQSDFAPTNVRFYMTETINYVSNSKLYNHQTFQEGSITGQLNLPNVINVYISNEAAGNCGYAAFWSNTVVLAKNCMGQGSTTWAHEMGHVLSLPHNFDSNVLPDDHGYHNAAPNNYERVDGSNCTNTGDGFCDTPPDYLGHRWTCNSDGMSTIEQTDPDGMKFRSDGYYIMSYANDGCSHGFSNEQTDAMSAFVEQERPEYVATPISFEAVVAEALPNPIPANDASLELDANSIISWDAIENASNYVIQISRLSSFNVIEHLYTTDEASVVVGADLHPNQTYYWRVWPYNRGSACVGFLPVNNFKTKDEVLSTSTIGGLDALQLTPNPSSTNTSTSLQFSLQTAQTLQLSLVDIMGQQHQMFSYQGLVGMNTISLSLNNLASGMYYVRLQNEGQQVVEKLVVY